MARHVITSGNVADAIDAVRDILLLYQELAQSYSGFGHAANVHQTFDPLRFVDAELLTPAGEAPLLDIAFLRTGSAMAILCALYDEWCECEAVDGGRYRAAILDGRLAHSPDVAAVAQEALRRGKISLEDRWFEDAVERLYHRHVIGHFAALSAMHRRVGDDTSPPGAARISSTMPARPPWWRRLFRSAKGATLDGMAYTTFCTLGSADGKRVVDILVFADGRTFLHEREQGEDGAFAERHGGSPVGPFGSPDEAERFIIATRWFRGEG